MVACEDDHRIVPLTGFVQCLQNSPELIVDLGDHGVIARLSSFGVVFLGRTNFILEIAIREFGLSLQVALLEMGTGHLFRIELLGVALRRSEGGVRIVNVDVEQPGLFAFLPDEFDRPFRCPGCLVQLGGYPVLALPELVQVATLFTNPVGIVVSFLPVVPWGMAKFPIAEPVVNPRLGSLARALQMKFSDHPAIIARLRNQFGDDGSLLREAFVSVAGVMNAAGIKSAHEACPTGRADGTLAISVGEGRATAHKRIQNWCPYVRVAQGTDRIEALLVGAVPENVWTFAHFKNPCFYILC